MVTQSANIFSSSGNGLDFGADHETLTILANVIVGSGAGDGVASDKTGSLLVNNGYVFSDADTVKMTGANATITNNGSLYSGDKAGITMSMPGTKAIVNNNSNGLVTGTDSGVTIKEIALSSVPGSIVVNNSGKIVGLEEFGISIFSSSAFNCASTINNHGIIRGASNGIAVGGNITSFSIDNYGTVEAKGLLVDGTGPILGGMGIDVNLPSTVTATITNELHGVINGKTAAILGEGGGFHLVNHGTINGIIEDTANKRDVIVNTGKINGKVLLGGGNDFFNGTGGTSGPIYAQGGSDRIIAGRGNVSIHFGSGNDTVSGGPGHDRFIFDTALTGQVGKITNYNQSLDKIVLSAADFAGVGPVGGALAGFEFHVGPNANTGSQRIIYNAGTGFLYYDQDGNGSAHAKIHFATIAAHLPLTHSDFLVVA